MKLVQIGFVANKLTERVRHHLQGEMQKNTLKAIPPIWYIHTAESDYVQSSRRDPSSVLYQPLTQLAIKHTPMLYKEERIIVELMFKTVESKQLQ